MNFILFFSRHLCFSLDLARHLFRFEDTVIDTIASRVCVCVQCACVIVYARVRKTTDVLFFHSFEFLFRSIHTNRRRTSAMQRTRITAVGWSSKIF